MTTFSTNQTVTANTTIQGVTKGETYRVVDVNTSSMGMFGTLVHYTVEGADGKQHVVTNGHIFLSAVPTDFNTQYELARKIGDHRFGSECKHVRTSNGKCTNCNRKVI